MEFTQGVRFDSLGLTEEVQRALKKKNIEESTPVQAGCIPPMREWKDVIAKAPTGTGKTFAFGIPIIEHIEPGSEETEAVILAPTRELAMQITAELRDLCAYLPGVRIVCLYGGAPIGKQIDALKKHPQIVVATPGRLSDHMKRRTVKLDNVKTVVLDEADRMLDMGFIHDVTRILDKLASRRNLGMFSATISREVMDISWMYQRDPEEITVQAKEENKPDIAQYRIDVGQNDKAHVMAQIIRAEGHERVMAFCNTKGMTERLKAFLMMEGLEADCIHGDIPQKKREAVMARFRRGELPIFVATDVAARGIDVSGVELVVQVEPPEDPKSFLHRSGRTARAGHSGDVVTIVLPNQRRRTRRMLHEAGLKVKPIEVTHDSPEVLELVGEPAEPRFGWTLEQSQPAGNPRRRKHGKGGDGSAENGGRSGRNRSGGRNKDRGKDKGGKPFKSERKDRANRKGREERAEVAEREQRFEPKQNRAERRAAKFEGRDNREYEAREHRWEHPEIQEEKREKHEEKRNNKRREKYARLHEQQRAEAGEQRGTDNRKRRSVERSDQRGQSDRKPGKKQYAKKQGAPTKKQRKAEARAERRYEDDRQYRRNRDERDDRRQGGKRIHRKEIRVIHDERGEDAKRYDRRMEAKYGDSGRRGGHGERHDKHAGERQGKPYRKHAKIRKAPFRSR